MKCDKCGADCPEGTVYFDGQSLCRLCYGWMRVAIDLSESLKHIQETQEGKVDDQKTDR